MKGEKYVFLIGAEHQVMQIDHAIKYFNLSLDNILILVQEQKESFDLGRYLIKSNLFSQVISFNNWTHFDIIFNKQYINKFIQICNDIKAEYSEIKFLPSHYSDDCTFLFISIIKPKKIFLLDEGTASFSVIVNRNKSYLMTIKLKIKSIFYGFKIEEPDKINYFSRYNLETNASDILIKYSISKKNNRVIYDFNELGFLGSSAVEVGLISEYKYLNYISIVRRYNSNLRLIYFSHRKEGQRKLDKIKNIGFEVINLSEPFELFYQNQSEMPHKLISFVTTSVLLNISDVFIQLPILEIYLFPLHSLKKQRDVYQKIIEHIRLVPNLLIKDIY